MVEEDHLAKLPPGYHDQDMIDKENLRSKFTLKQFIDKLMANTVLTEVFAEDETILY